MCRKQPKRDEEGVLVIGREGVGERRTGGRAGALALGREGAREGERRRREGGKAERDAMDFRARSSAPHFHSSLTILAVSPLWRIYRISSSEPPAYLMTQ